MTITVYRKEEGKDNEKKLWFTIDNVSENDFYHMALALQFMIKHFEICNLSMEDVSQVSLNCAEMLKKIPDLQKEEEVQEMDARPEGARKFVMGKGWTK